MGRLIASGLFISLVLTAFSAEVGAQIVFTDDFENGSSNWFISSAPSTSEAGWAADNSPMLVAGSGSSASSGSNSLNYNDDMTGSESYQFDLNTGGGTSFGGGGNPGNYGFAFTMPGLIDISSLSTAELSFWCNYDTEAEDDFDIRVMAIMDSAGSAYLLERQYLPAGSAGAPTYFSDFEVCDTAGFGHWHTVTLDPAWGDIVISFEMDTMDSSFNDYDGWFIDDVTVGPAGTGGGGGGGGGGGSVEDSILYRPHAGGKDSDGRAYQDGGCSGFIAQSESFDLISLASFFGSLLLLVVVGRRFRA